MTRETASRVAVDGEFAPEQSVATLRGDVLVELEGKRWYGGHRVKDRDLGQRFPRRAAPRG